MTAAPQSNQSVVHQLIVGLDDPAGVVFRYSAFAATVWPRTTRPATPKDDGLKLGGF
jgi:hypothetical protein